MTIEEFVSARLPALMRYSALLASDVELGRDLVQEVLARAMSRWNRIGTLHDPYGYVRRMVTNEYLSLLRRRRIRTVPLTYEALDGPRARREHRAQPRHPCARHPAGEPDRPDEQ